MPQMLFDEGMVVFQPRAVGVEIVLGEGALPVEQRGGGAKVPAKQTIASSEVPRRKTRAMTCQ